MFREHRDFELRGRVPRERQVVRGSSYRAGFVRPTSAELFNKLKTANEGDGKDPLRNDASDINDRSQMSFSRSFHLTFNYQGTTIIK